jgi:hypothetical protein
MSTKRSLIIGLMLVVVMLFAALPMGEVSAAVTVTTEAELDAAIAGSESTITLGADFSISATKTISRTIDLDLNGKTLSFTVTDTSPAFNLIAGGSLTVNDTTGSGVINVNGGATLWKGKGISVREGASLTVNGGTVKGEYAGIYVYGNTIGVGNTITTINAGATVGGNETSFGVVVLGKAELIINGGLITAKSFGISGNGTAGNGGTKIQIDGGAIVSTTFTAIYHPQDGLINITGGSITGPTGIEIKSGELNVSGGTITGTGPFVPNPLPSGSGSVDTGDAIFVNSHSSYTGDIDVNITGGVITSTNSFAVREYNTLGDLKSAILITGGTLTGGAGQTSIINKVVNVTQGIGYTTIQGAIDAASTGDTVNVAAGTYDESNILVDKTLTIQGVGATRSDVVIVPAGEDDNVDSAFGGVYQNGFIIKANDVTIKNLTLDGRGNSSLTPDKNNFRIGIVSADSSYPGGGGGVWSNLHVDNVHIKYPYRRGISVWPAQVSGTLIENSRIEYVAFNQAIAMAGQGEVLNNEVHHAFQGIIVGPDASTPAGLIKINGNILTDIGNFEGVWGYPNGQPRAIQFNNSDSAGRPVEIKNNVISDNGFEQYGGAVGIYTRLPNSDSIVSGNQITLTSGVSWSEPGSQAVGMLLGWAYEQGFLAENNEINMTKYGIGIMVHDSGSVTNPLKLKGNTITSSASAANEPSDSSGIYVSNEYLFYTTDTGSSYVELTDINEITGFVTGINVENLSTSGQTLTVIAEENQIYNNTKHVVTTGTSEFHVDASPNWWGSDAGPGASRIEGDVDFTPWCGDAACSFLVPDENGVIVLDGEYHIPGGIVIDEPNLTILIKDGTVIENESPCFTVNASFTTIKAESIGGAQCIPTGDDNGIDVAAGLMNIIIEGLEFVGTTGTDGIHFAGAITDVVIVDNWFHGFAGDGIEFTAQPAGTVVIQGNLFQNNTGLGINASTFTVGAAYNAWGHYTAPVVGTDISANVVATPYTHVDLTMESSQTPWTNQVVAGDTITYTIKGSFVNAVGADFKLTYPSSLLTIVGTPTLGTHFTIPAETTVIDISTAGVISFAGRSSYAETFANETLFTVTFTADPAGSGVMGFDETSDAFAMFPGTGPSLNIYATALVDGSVKFIDLPTMTSADLVGPYIAGIPKEFSLTITNPALGGTFANPQLQFTLPAGAVLEYNNGGWVTVVVGELDIAAMAPGDFGTPFLFRVTFLNKVSAFNVVVDLVDTDAADELLATLEQLVDVDGEFTITGTVSMQGRTNRAGVPMRLTKDGLPVYGPFNATSINVISNNLTFTLVNGGTYTITTLQPRYLNVTAALAKTLLVNGPETIATLELKGGNAVWSDNIINTGDASLVGTYYGQFIANDADVNFSGKVDIFDLALVGGNFDLTSAVVYGTWTP